MHLRKDPRETIQVKAIRPDRDALEIRFPRVEGYRVELPEDALEAEFNDDSILELSPDLVGPSITKNSGIIGADVDLTLTHLEGVRPSILLFHLTKRLLYSKFRDPGDEPRLHLFGQLKRVTKQWLDSCLVCKGSTYPAQLMYQDNKKVRVAGPFTVESPSPHRVLGVDENDELIDTLKENSGGYTVHRTDSQRRWR